MKLLDRYILKQLLSTYVFVVALLLAVITVIDDGMSNAVSNYYSKSYLRHLMKSQEILGLTIASIHNLAFYLWLVEEARKHIIEGNFENWKRETIEVLKTRL